MLLYKKPNLISKDKLLVIKKYINKYLNKYYEAWYVVPKYTS